MTVIMKAAVQLHHLQVWGFWVLDCYCIECMCIFPKFLLSSLTLRLLMSCIYMEHLFLMFLDHTRRRTTVGRTPLDEWSARRRNLYLTTHDTHNRQISMPPVGFVVRAGLRPLTCWDLGFESHQGHGYLSVVIVVCCQVEVSATSWSLVQRSPTNSGASLCVI